MEEGRMATPKPCSAKVMAGLGSFQFQDILQINTFFFKKKIKYFWLRCGRKKEVFDMFFI